MDTIFMNLENSKTNEPHKCVLRLSHLLSHILLQKVLEVLMIQIE